jgi:hypothetical protein
MVLMLARAFLLLIGATLCGRGAAKEFMKFTGETIEGLAQFAH